MKTTISVLPIPHLIENCLVRKGYRNLSIPEELYLELEWFVEKSKGRYISIAEVVRVAIREFLERDR